MKMEQMSLGNRYKECRPRRAGSCQNKAVVGKDVLNELEQRRSSPSVIAKLMGIDALPPSVAVRSQSQQFKDVFEVSEEPPEVAAKERSHHFPKGLPSLQRALRLKRLVPSKTLYGDDTHDCKLHGTYGSGSLNSVEINNPLFEKWPRDMNYSANYQDEKEAASVCRRYPVGLANSSLSSFRILSKGKDGDFNSIVVLEPCLEKDNEPENVFPVPYLSPVNKNCRRETKHKQCEFPVTDNGKFQQHLLDNEYINVPRIRKERFFTSDSIDPLSVGQGAPFHQFGTVDASCSGSSQRYSCNGKLRQTNRSSSNGSLSKIRRHDLESAVGSKTLAEMFALSDSEKLKLISNSNSPIRHDKIDQDNGHGKDGCFIVLPKHAPLLSSWSSNDRNPILEGLSQGRNNPNTYSNNNNVKCHFDSFGDKPCLLKQVGNDNKANLRKAYGFKPLVTDNISNSDCLNEKVLFTIDEDLAQQPAESEPSAFHLQLSRKQRATRLPIHYHEYGSISVSDRSGGTKSCKGLKEVEQPSPVSILDPPTDEDDSFSGRLKYDIQYMANVEKRRGGHQHDDEPEVSTSIDDEGHSAYQSLEAFQVEEDRDFSYLLDILICSGIIVADWQLICKSWYSPGCPVGPHVFDRLERKYNKIAKWAKPERRLLFDLINSVLSEVLAPCLDVHPWVQPTRHCAPLWGPEGPVEKVWQTIVRQREDSVTGHPDEMVLDTKWLEAGDDIIMVGKQIARMLHCDLFEEVIVDLL